MARAVLSGRLRGPLLPATLALLTGLGAWAMVGPGVWAPNLSFGDQYLYLDVAHSLASGLGYQLSQHQAWIVFPGQPTAFWMPGLPLLLSLGAALGGGDPGALFLVRLLAVLGGVAGTLAVYRLAEALAGRGAALLAAVTWALFPVRILVGTMALAEGLYIPLLLWSLVLALRGTLAARAGAGLLLALACLLRGEALLAGIALAVGLGLAGLNSVDWRGRRLGARIGLALLLLPCLLVAGGWAARNLSQVGAASLETRSDFVLWVRLDGSTPSFPYRGWDSPWFGEIAQGDHPGPGWGQGAGPEVQAQAERISQALPEGRRAARLRALALSHAVEHPVQVAAHLSLQATALVLPRLRLTPDIHPAPAHWPGLWRESVGWAASLLVVAGAVAWLALRRTARDGAVSRVLLTMIAIQALITAVGANPSDLRHRLRLDALLIPLAAAGALQAVGWARRRGSGAAADG